MAKLEITVVLELHKKWLRGEPDGKRADLRGADLRGADLRGADLRGADLTDADLRDADLRGADLDFSVWPLWCGSLRAKIGRRLFCQLAYHLCRVVVDDHECVEARKALVPLANEFHRVKVGECMRIDTGEGPGVSP